MEHDVAARTLRWFCGCCYAGNRIQLPEKPFGLVKCNCQVYAGLCVTFLTGSASYCLLYEHPVSHAGWNVSLRWLLHPWNDAAVSNAQKKILFYWESPSQKYGRQRCDMTTKCTIAEPAAKIPGILQVTLNCVGACKHIICTWAATALI